MEENRMANETDIERELLRHALATIAYRGGKALRDVPPEFADFRASETTRTPLAILAHIGDLLGWSLSIAKGKREYKAVEPQGWDEDVKRFFASLNDFDEYLASDEPLVCSAKQLLQAPIADSLTHIGQIAMLRRMAGTPMRAENYFVAKIATGTVGADQPAPVFEFD
jgi:hypothetical protein